MSISSEITRIQNAKTALKSSIEAKGVSVPAEAKIDAYPTLVDSISSGGGQEISGQEEITVKFGEDLNAGDAVYIIRRYSFTSGTPTNPNATFPAASVGVMSICYDATDTYLLCTLANSPIVSSYIRNNFYHASYIQPSTKPATVLSEVTFNTKLNHAACASNSYGVFLYVLENDGVYTSLGFISDNPAGNGTGVSYSTSGTYLAVAHTVSPYITLYSIDGTTYTKLTQPETIPSGATNGIRFAPTDTYLGVTSATAPYLMIYKHNAGALTYLPDAMAAPPTVACKSVDFSYNSEYMVVGHTASPWFSTYKREGDTFTKLAIPTSTYDRATSAVHFVKFNSYEQVFAITQASSIIGYKMLNDIPKKVSTFPSLGSNATSISWTKDGYLTAAASGDAIIKTCRGGADLGLYAFKSNNLTKGSNNTAGLGYAKESGLAGEEKKVIKIWG